MQPAVAVARVWKSPVSNEEQERVLLWTGCPHNRRDYRAAMLSSVAALPPQSYSKLFYKPLPNITLTQFVKIHFFSTKVPNALVLNNVAVVLRILRTGWVKLPSQEGDLINL